jgi:hypothetical protein
VLCFTSNLYVEPEIRLDIWYGIRPYQISGWISGTGTYPAKSVSGASLLLTTGSGLLCDKLIILRLRLDPAAVDGAEADAEGEIDAPAQRNQFRPDPDDDDAPAQRNQFRPDPDDDDAPAQRNQLRPDPDDDDNCAAQNKA